MSGQPVRTPLDVDKFRREYLNQLQLRADLDNENLQANKVYKRTGQKNELQDYRTPAEKLADTELLKRTIRGELNTITTPAIASEILNTIGDRDLPLLAQNLPAMLPTLKKLYAVGITDANQFLDYYRRYINKLQITGGVELGLQQSTGEALLLGVNQILREAVSVEQLREIAELVRDTSVLGRRDRAVLLEQIGEVSNGLDLMKNDIADIMRNSRNYDPTVIADIQETVNRLSNQLPTNAQIQAILNRIDTLSRIRDVEGVKEKIVELEGILTQDKSFSLELRTLQNMISELTEEVKTSKELPSVGEFQYLPIGELRGLSLNRLKVYIDDLSKTIGTADFLRMFDGTSPAEVKKLNKEEILRRLEVADDDIKEVLRDLSPRKMGGKGMCGGGECKCMVGSGLVRRAYTPKPTDIDEEAGVAPTPKYVKLGRYLIHKGKMADDIISIRRPSGTFVGEFPSQRVSKNLGKVFRNIVGGNILSFDDINSLNEEERIYLHKLAKSARIDDKLNIPAPKMEEDDKDIRRFEVLKGQILSGNDNREMVKEFKILLLKLSKKGHIPKGQVKDILIDLASMGF